MTALFLALGAIALAVLSILVLIAAPAIVAATSKEPRP